VMVPTQYDPLNFLASRLRGRRGDRLKTFGSGPIHPSHRPIIAHSFTA